MDKRGRPIRIRPQYCPFNCWASESRKPFCFNFLSVEEKLLYKMYAFVMAVSRRKKKIYL